MNSSPRGAQELGLSGEVGLADLVEEERAAVGDLELPARARVGAGERAALVAEQLDSMQVRGDRGAVEARERERRFAGS
jgi:hypothetical protein